MSSLKLKNLFMACSCALLASTVVADIAMEPGLWEIRNRTTIDGEQLPDMRGILKEVPPEARAQMQEALAMQGIGLTDAGVRICISPAQAQQNDVPVMEDDKDCTVTRSEQGKGHWTFEIQCRNPAGTGSGEVQLLDSKRWKSHYQVTREGQGDYNTMEINGAGRWVSSDCGNIQPQQR
ncbi:MAG: DUF3617 domain-containing protein [Gammaproteobacteria bacterium]|nr:MAG: DUF3617 domain-containing protein [Gammaproteobacteria bacterium]